MKTLITAVLIFCLASIVNAQVSSNVNFDTILPPASGGTTTIEKKENVKIEKSEKVTIVHAVNAQDAANASVEFLDEAGIDNCVKMEFPSGEGFMASGFANYELFPNIDRNRLVKRQAFCKAYIAAKAALASTLGTPEVSERIKMDYYVTDVVGKEKTVHTSAENYEENIGVLVRHLVQGHVIYKIKDDKEKQLISVSIFVTPKTVRAISRTGQVYMDASDLRNGVQMVLTSIQNGVVPPVGGTIVTVPNTNAIAYVSFGCAPVLEGDTPKVKSDNKRTAYDIAELRSNASMLELLNGDNITNSRKMLETTKDSIGNFAEMLEKDPLESTEFSSSDRLDAQNEQRAAVQRVYRSTVSTQQGKLPSGISTKTWIDDEGAWVYCVKVYLPKGIPSPIVKPKSVINPNISEGVVTDPNSL